MLGKMLNIGGMDNSSPKTTQSNGRFRVARNVQPTPDGRIIPRYHNTYSVLDADDYMYLATVNYEYRPLHLIATSATGLYADPFKLRMSYAGSSLPCSDESFEVDAGLGINDGEDYSQAVTTYRNKNTVYFQIPWGAKLIKYDGVEFSKAGVDTPRFYSSAYNAAGTKYIKVLKHAVDFDGNDLISEAVTFPVLAATTAIPIVGIAPSGDLVGLANVTPAFLSIDSIGQPNRFRGTATYQAGTNDFLINTAGANYTNITDVERIGSYVVVAINKTEMTTWTLDGFALALKVKSVSPLVLDMDDAKILNPRRDWITIDLGDLAPGIGVFFAAQITKGSREYLSIWASPSLNGVYSYQGFQDVPLLGTEGATFSIASPPSLTIAGSTDNIAILGPTLNGIYDVTSVPKSPNSMYDSGVGAHFGITTFQELAILYDADNIHISNYLLGGSFEQIYQIPLTIGTKEFGRITTVCGTQDFLFVSRERKNYYVAGNIATGNYRVQEIIGAEIGGWCNNSSVNIKDSVVFITALGLFQVSGGGKAIALSDKTPKNFSTYDNYTNPTDDVVFRLNGTTTRINTDFTVPQDSLPGLAVGYDEYRELLIFCYKDSNSPCLVFHTKNGELFEWDSLGYTGFSGEKANSIAFVESVAYWGGNGIPNGIDGYATPAYEFVEDKTIDLAYSINSAPTLYSTWLTAGEPSLEKQLLQLKFFGRVEVLGTTGGLEVVHWRDWKTSTPVTFTTYRPDIPAAGMSAQEQYSHKKRLNSDKVLAVSVGIRSPDPKVSFELESFEVEFMPIQQGIKK